ncbi:hypothetical protein MIND_01347500 [Mycena indigotica]|uniref:Uncharacterized protein n=1 Tax=Mycena indigotica TaxID=2126181 RepID=A0A8H6VQ95_9AGAR|nr:uncharacterized protein MIND_01347500 [Mycena indigotica]KAF7289739.1 hypothetical protein MIND_01347500 [Mycena indigotica]
MPPRRKATAVTYVLPDLPPPIPGQTSTLASVIHQYNDIRSDGSITLSAATHQLPTLGSIATVVPDTHDTIAGLSSEHLVYELELDVGGSAREMRDSDDPLRQWAEYHRDDFLSELLRHEGRRETPILFMSPMYVRVSDSIIPLP